MSALWDFHLDLCKSRSSTSDSTQSCGDSPPDPCMIQNEQKARRRPAPIIFGRRVQRTDTTRSESCGEGSSEQMLESTSFLNATTRIPSSRACYNRIVGLQLAAEASNSPQVGNSEHEKDLLIAFLLLADNCLVYCDIVG
jgi:hypothetical protein